jgi:hypothetical protein
MIEINVRKKYTRVDLSECSQEALDSFGSIETLKVNGDLSLRGCSGLTRLPDGSTVGGGLYISGCTGLIKLPDGLTVGGLLNLRNCTGITRLPEDLQVGGMIWYSLKTGFFGHKYDPGVIPDRLKHKLENRW